MIADHDRAAVEMAVRDDYTNQRDAMMSSDAEMLA